jgi:hypothetical protein
MDARIDCNMLCLFSYVLCSGKSRKRDKTILRRAHCSRHESNEILSSLGARSFRTPCLLMTDARLRRANSETGAALGRHSLAIHCHKVGAHPHLPSSSHCPAVLVPALARVSSCGETQVKSRQTCLGATLLPGPRACLVFAHRRTYRDELRSQRQFNTTTRHDTLTP